MWREKFSLGNLASPAVHKLHFTQRGCRAQPDFYEPCIIEMNNGQTFEVARRKKQEVLERLKK
ncbi:hypothetical protein BH11BAC7_BH11BAC7_18200 [soil metagenome]